MRTSPPGRRPLLAFALAVALVAGLSSPSAAAPATVVIDNAAYSWWGQPLAVNDGAVTWVAGVARQGTLRLARVTAATGEVRMTELSREFHPNRPDDHNTPAIAYQPGRADLVVFYTGHNYDGVLRYRTVDRSTMATGPERRLTFSGSITYAQVLRHEDRLVVLTRVSSSTWRYRISDDFGGTWGPERILVDARGFGQVYVVTKPVPGDPDENLLAFYGHPVNSTYRPVDLARIRLSTGNVEHVDGRVAGNLFDSGGPAFRPGELGAAITPSPDHTVRLLDIGVIGQHPAIAYAVWRGTTGQATYKVKLYRNGAFDSPQWSLPSGDPFGFDPATHYVGGTVITGDDHLYTARKHNPTGTWHVEQWRWSPSANTFTHTRELARDAHHALVRPYVPARPGATEVLYQRLNHYDGFTDYDIDTLLAQS